MIPAPDVATPRPAGAVSTPRRADVEGLRIVAVLLVVIYHFAGAGVSGGVDAFLFISGYFVLGGLLRRVGDGRAIGLRAFYARTARRLVPAAGVTALATLVAAWFLGHGSQRPQYLAEYVASSLYVENVWLAERGVVYGAATAHENPFQHFWSLSVQGQIFLLAPLVAVAGAALVARLPAVRRRRAVTVGVVVLLAAAAAYAFVATAADQSGAYLSTGARGWELLAGAVLATSRVGERLPGWFRAPLGWASLALLCAAGLLVDGAHTFPGPAALVPLAATAGVLAAGAAPTRYGVDRLLGLPALATAGRYSYALYLVHWPVMTVLLLAAGRERLDLPTAALAVALSALLTVALHHGVEARMRHGAPRPLRRPVQVTGAVLVAVAVVGAVAVRPAVVERTSLIGGAVLAAELEGTSGADCSVFGIERGLSCAFDDVIVHADAGAGSIALLGGSHSALWTPTLVEVTRDLGVELRSFIRSRCPHFADRRGLPGFDDPAGDNCAAWNHLTTQRLLDRPPSLVVTTLSRAGAPDGRVEWIPDGYRAVWEELGAAGIPVLAVRHNPRITAEAWLCVERHVTDLDRCSFERDDLFAADDELFADGLPPNVTVLDVTPHLCRDGVCPAQLDGHPTFSDRSHVSLESLRTMDAEMHACVASLLEASGGAVAACGGGPSAGEVSRTIAPRAGSATAGARLPGPGRAPATSGGRPA